MEKNLPEFISEDDLHTFEGWMRYQGFGDPSALGPEELVKWRGYFDESMERSAAIPKVGLMKLRPTPGEHRYAVAIRDGADLWLTLWVRRSSKGEFFVFLPRGDRGWNPHASYHRDGTFHSKSYDRKHGQPRKRQPLTDAFQGTEPLGIYAGHGGKSIGAVCDPKAFSGIVEVPVGVLGPRDGVVSVDLVEPGCEPIAFYAQIVTREVFQDVVPWVVITIGRREMKA